MADEAGGPASHMVEPRVSQLGDPSPAKTKHSDSDEPQAEAEKTVC